MDRAIEEWQRAEKLRPDPEVEQALDKAQRDKAEEETYREGETAHFALKYNGGATPDLARGILHVLEDDSETWNRNSITRPASRSRSSSTRNRLSRTSPAPRDGWARSTMAGSAFPCRA